MDSIMFSVTHVSYKYIFSGCYILIHVCEICSNNSIEITVFVSFIKLAHSICEKTKGCTDKYSLGTHVLELLGWRHAPQLRYVFPVRVKPCSMSVFTDSSPAAKEPVMQVA